MTAAGATIGKSYLHESDEPACYAGYLVRFRHRPDVDPRFVAYWTESHPYWQQIETGAVKSTIENFSAGRYRNLELSVPPHEEQRAIADFLDRETTRIDELMRTRLQLVHKVEERIEAMIAGRVMGASASRKRKVGPFIIPAHWNVGRLSTLMIGITDGPFGSALTSGHYHSEGARVVRLGNLGTAEFKDGDQAYIGLNHYRKLIRHSVRPGDLLMAGLGDEARPLGRACVAPEGIEPAIVKADCYRIRLNPKLLRHDYASWFLSSQPGIQSTAIHARGSTRARINTQVAKQLPMPVPPLEEQAAIASHCDAIRERLRRLQRAVGRQLELLQEHRQTLITTAVSPARGV